MQILHTTACKWRLAVASRTAFTCHTATRGAIRSIPHRERSSLLDRIQRRIAGTRNKTYVITTRWVTYMSFLFTVVRRESPAAFLEDGVSPAELGFPAALMSA